MAKNSNIRQAKIEDSFARQFRADTREQEKSERRARLTKTRTRWADEGQHQTMALAFARAMEGK